MQNKELIPDLFRTEYRKIVAVLCKLLGVENIQIAEDIVSDTFLSAFELWTSKGLPQNPTAWLYLVAKNKTKDYLKRNALFAQSISKEIKHNSIALEELALDLSVKNIHDSQLAMIFVVCHPCNPPEAQIGLALNLLCGFGVDEIASALLTNKSTVYKQLQRAKERLRIEEIQIVQPTVSELNDRLPSVLLTLYLLFNEGYYSANQSITFRKEFCVEAMRLTLLLVENEKTSHPFANALLALMCFHASRFDARLDPNNEIILYQDQDTAFWNQELISKGEYYLNHAASGDALSKYHLEAGIAYWHTVQSDKNEKWENILFFYDRLLALEYSPVVALNRAYAFAKVHGKNEAIVEAEKVNLRDNHLYHSLLGELYSEVDVEAAILHFQKALTLSKAESDKVLISNRIFTLSNQQITRDT